MDKNVESYIPMKDKFEELKKVLDNIKKGEKILLIGDNDGDGIPGCAIFSKILKKYGFEYKKDFDVIFINHDFKYTLTQDKQKQEFFRKYDYFILIDTAFNLSFLQSKFVCIMDHHKVDAKADLMINPQFYNETKNDLNCCACALVYCAYRYIFGKNKLLEKIAFASSLADWMPMGSLPYLGISHENTEYFVNGGYVVPSNNILNTICFLQDDKKFGAKWAFEKLFLETDKNLKSIVLLPEEFYKKLNKQKLRFSQIAKTIFDKVQEYNNVIFLILDHNYKEFKPNINVDLQAIYPGTTMFLIFENKQEKRYQFSCRSQTHDLVKLIGFLKKKCKTVVGGGHSVAAGFFVNNTEFVICKQLIIQNIKQFKN